MGLSCFRAISGMGWVGWVGWVGWDLCAGLFYEHRFAMLIKEKDAWKCENSETKNWNCST